MKIDTVVEKYLNEDKQSDFTKWTMVVKSCKTTDQLNSAINMGQNLYVKYGERVLSKILSPFGTPFLDILQKVISNKRDKLSYEDSQKILKEIN